MEAPGEFHSLADGYVMRAMVETVHEFRHARLLQLISEHGTVQALADALGRSHSQISQLRNRSAHSVSGRDRVIGDDLARDIEDKLGKPRGWMDTPFVGEPSSPQGRAAVAHGLSQQTPTLPPPTMRWEELHLNGPLPPVFEMVLVDDAMAPLAVRGTRVKFKAQASATPGQAVLVRTNTGETYFRVYRVPTPGTWSASPTNAAYPTLDATRDQLVILAVFIGIEADWSQIAQ